MIIFLSGVRTPHRIDMALTRRHRSLFEKCYNQDWFHREWRYCVLLPDDFNKVFKTSIEFALRNIPAPLQTELGNTVSEQPGIFYSLCLTYKPSPPSEAFWLKCKTYFSYSFDRQSSLLSMRTACAKEARPLCTR